MKSGQDLLLVILVAGYGVLLRLYPRSFRNEFAEEMTAVFGATLRDAAARGPVAVAKVWFSEMGSYPFNLARAYFDSWGEEKAARTGGPGVVFLSTWTILSALAPVAAFALSFPFLRLLIEALGPTVVRYGHSGPTEDALGHFVFFPALGLILGAVQALLLRRYLGGAWRWLLAIVAGWMAALVFQESTVATARLTEIKLHPALWTWLPLVGLGLLSGSLQWLLFRHTISGAVWFLFASLLGAALIPDSREYLGDISYLGQFMGMTAVPGVLSGVTAMLLLRNRGGSSRRAATGKERQAREKGDDKVATGRARRLSDSVRCGPLPPADGAYVRTLVWGTGPRKGDKAP